MSLTQLVHSLLLDFLASLWFFFSVSNNMSSVKDNLCLVIDLEGFSVQKKIQVHEMGYYSWNEHFDRYAFFQPSTLKDISQG